MILENGFSAPYLIGEWMNSDQTYIYVYCDLEFIIDTIYFNNMSVQTGGGTYVFLRKHCSSLLFNLLYSSILSTVCLHGIES